MPDQEVLRGQVSPGLGLRRGLWGRRGSRTSGGCLMGPLPLCSWRFGFYLCSFFGGLSVLYHVSVPGRLPAPPPIPQGLAVP